MTKESFTAYHYSPKLIHPDHLLNPQVSPDPCVPYQVYQVPLLWFTTRKEIVYDKSLGAAAVLFIYTLQISPEEVFYWDFDVMGWAATSVPQTIHHIESIKNPYHKHT